MEKKTKMEKQSDGVSYFLRDRLLLDLSPHIKGKTKNRKEMQEERENVNVGKYERVNACEREAERERKEREYDGKPRRQKEREIQKSTYQRAYCVFIAQAIVTTTDNKNPHVI